jgi:hypothetical protein
MYVSESEILYAIGLIDTEIRYYEDYKWRLIDFLYSERKNLPKKKFLNIQEELNSVSSFIHLLRNKQDQYHKILIHQQYGNHQKKFDY